MASDNPPIVSADWLLERHDAAKARTSGLVVVHVGTKMVGGDPHQTFRERHLAGAVSISLDDDLAAAPAPIAGRHPLPDAAAFSDVLARLGISSESQVVAYDDRNGAFAARLVWMLRAIGQRSSLLDGSIDAWHGPFDQGDMHVQRVERAVVEWPADAVADADEVARHLAAGGVVVDSRAADRYAGLVEPIDRIAGHVPGAINLPFEANLNTDGTFLDPSELADRFEAVAADQSAIVYCGSGVTACHNALAIEAAGLPRPRVYIGSWSGWSSDPERPIASA